jgi:hypothetical protein
MGTRPSDTTAQAVARIAKPPKCSVCRQVITDNCNWMQGRCPHRSDMITVSQVKIRFTNLINFLKGKIKWR